MSRRNPTSRGEHLALLAQLLAESARRYDEAARRLNDARGATRSATYDGPPSRSSDTPTPTLSPDVEAVEHDHHSLTDAYKNLVTAEKTIATIVNRWAAVPTRSVAQWCENHLRYDINEPRGTDGSRNCDWCSNVKRNYGKWPTKDLARLHAEGRRISDNEYRRLLGIDAA